MTLKTVQNCEKTALGSELLNFICEDIKLDSREIHPPKCVRPVGELLTRSN